MASNSETRKLYLYARDNNFKTVDAITCLAFFALAEIPVKQKDLTTKVSETAKTPVDNWPCFLVRTSTLRKHPAVVAGSTQILRFIYQTEIIEYDWYPQNPLDRARLD